MIALGEELQPSQRQKQVVTVTVSFVWEIVSVRLVHSSVDFAMAQPRTFVSGVRALGLLYPETKTGAKCVKIQRQHVGSS